MAWTPEGFWKPDDSDDTQGQVARVIDAGGDLMKRARGLGTMMASKRGLGNSTLAAESAQNAVLDKAVTIGGQTAAQNSAKNLAALNANENLKYGTTLQQQQDVAAKDRLGMQITSNEGIAGADRSSTEALTREKYATDIQLAREGNTAAMDRLVTQLGTDRAIEEMRIGANERLSSAQIAAEMSRLQTSIASNERLAAQGDAAARDRLQLDLASRQQLQTQAEAAQASMQTADIGSRMALQSAQDAATLQRQREELENRTAITGQQLTSAQTIAAGEQTGATTRQQMQSESALALQTAADTAAGGRQTQELTSREGIAGADRTAEAERLGTTIAGNRANAELDATTRLNLGQMDSDTSRANTALGAATTLASAHLQAMSAVMNNENIPADVRASYQDSVQRATEGNIGLIEQITGQDLAWGNNPIVPAGLPSAATAGGNPSSAMAAGDQAYYGTNGNRFVPQGGGSWAEFDPNGVALNIHYADGSSVPVPRAA